MPGKIFISYRRLDDPGTAGRLFDALNEAFDPDRLFLDVDSIEPGLDFVEVIEDRVAQSAILLAVIGRHWIDASDERGNRRLDDAQDHVRIEIESALKQNKRVIPVLIGDTKMPAAELLPESVRKLARHNAIVLRYERFHDDMANLTKALKRALGDDKPPPAPVQPQPVGLYAATPAPLPDKQSPALIEKLLRVRVPLLACVAAVVLAGGAYLYYEPDAGSVSKPSSAPGPVVSVAPTPSSSNLGHSKFDLDLTPVISAPASNASSNAARTPASGEKPAWCSEDHLKLDELTICATESLWALDSQLNDAFGRYSATVPDPKALSDDEAKWVRETRRPCGVDEQCLARVYNSRILYFTASLLKR